MNNISKTDSCKSPYKVEWTDDLLTGNKEIDHHHKEIIESLNNYCALIQYEISESVVIDMINQISYDVTKHFTEEEQYMHDIEYPDFEKHQKSHRAFLSKFYELKSDWEKNSDNIDTKENLITFCLKATKNHIITMDKTLALYSINKQ